ncbi:hypothetical protein PGB90_002647 [Kerria lacca]
MRKIIILLSVFAVACTYKLKKNIVVNNVNNVEQIIIDEIIDLALKKIESIQQPVALEDIVKKYTKTILSTSINTEIILYDGKLWGIENIKREDDASFKFYGMDVNVNSSFHFDSLNYTYNFEANFLNLSTKGILQGKIAGLIADVGLLIDLRNKTIKLTDLKLTKAKKFEIRIDSPKYIYKFLNYVLRFITSDFKNILLTQMEKELQTLLGRTVHFQTTNIN